MPIRFVVFASVLCLVIGSAGCSGGDGKLAVDRTPSVAPPAGYHFGVVVSRAGALQDTSEGPLGLQSGGDTWTVKPGAYDVKVAYFPCDQTCSVAGISARVQAAPMSCQAHVNVRSDKTTRVSTTYDRGVVACNPTSQ